MICPLHGPILREDLGHYIGKYDTWSSYAVEDAGVVVAYTSVYGHTREAAEQIARLLRDKGETVVVYDLARCDIARATADAFRYGKLVLATTTYNADIFPFMKQFLDHLTERNFQNRKVGLVENGAWAPMAAKIMRAKLEGCKNLTFAEPVVTLRAALNADSRAALAALADAMAE